MLVLGTKQHRRNRKRSTWIVPISRSLQQLVGILLVFVGTGGTNSSAVGAFSTNTVVPLIIPVSSSQQHKNCRPYPPLTKHHYNRRTLHPISMAASSTATTRGSSSLNAKEKEANNTGTNNNHDNTKPKKGRSSDWKQAIAEFKASVLDDAYLPVPIRGTCVNMALTDYPQTRSSSSTTTNTSTSTTTARDTATLMPGAHKHLGGVKDTEGNGCIYGVPANAKAILCLYPTTAQNTQIVHGHQTARVAQRRHQEQVRRDAKERTKQARKQKYGRSAQPPTTTTDDSTTTPPQYEEHGKNEETEWTEEQLQAIGAAQATTSRRSRLTRRGSVPGTYAGWKLTPEEEAALHMDEEEEDNTPDDHNPGTGGYTLTTIPLPKRIMNREMKWLRGIIANGYLWAIPAWADCVLCVDIAAYWHQREKTFLADDAEEPDQDTMEGYVRLLPLPKTTPGGNQRWQWHGAGINIEQTAIYCIPSNAQQVLKVDLQTQTTSYIEIEYDRNKYPDFTLDVTNKWYGGIVGNDNAIYGIPYRACGVLRIDSITETATIIGPNYGIGKYFWHGGVKCQSNGKIYAHPSHADTVLVIDTLAAATAFANSSKDDGTIHDYDHIIFELTIHRASYDHDEKTTNYKWLGGSIGADGNIYCPACDTSALLKINPTTDYCETFGFAGTEKNKWQGGILSTRDDCIYCIPANGIHVCRIYTGNNTNQKKNDDNVNNDVTSTNATPAQLIGDLSDHKDKWQGASMGEDGALYFIPENGYRVMKVTPPPTPPVIIDGKLPDGDVKIELI